MSAAREFKPTVIELEYLLVRKLRPAAAARETTVPRLVVNLLDTIVCDALVDAVLDDGAK